MRCSGRRAPANRRSPNCWRSTASTIPRALLRIDMTEYRSHDSSLNKLFGAVGGLVTSTERQGILCDWFDDPSQGKYGGVVLIDEAERGDAGRVGAPYGVLRHGNFHRRRRSPTPGAAPHRHLDEQPRRQDSVSGFDPALERRSACRLCRTDRGKDAQTSVPDETDRPRRIPDPDARAQSHRSLYGRGAAAKRTDC